MLSLYKPTMYVKHMTPRAGPGHNLNKLSRSPLGDAIKYQGSIYALWFQDFFILPLQANVNHLTPLVEVH